MSIRGILVPEGDQLHNNASNRDADAIFCFLVMTLEFCLNVFAGVVASAIFIQDQTLMTKRMAICVGLIIGLKIILVNLVHRYFVRDKWLEFIAVAHAAPPIPNGGRPL
jgi:hypothetical protein